MLKYDLPDLCAQKVFCSIDGIYAVSEQPRAWAALVSDLLDLLALLDAAPARASVEAQLIKMLEPHLLRSLRQQSQIAQQRETLAFQGMLLDGHHLAIAMCDAGGAVLWANEPMQQQLQTVPASTLEFLTAPGTLRPASASLTMEQRPVQLLALSVPPFGCGKVVLLAAAAQPVRLDLNLLKTLFGLTRAESKVAQALAEGLAPEAIGVHHGISLHTVRSHLKKVMCKTATSRQNELLARLLGSPAHLNFPAMAGATDPRAVGKRLMIGSRVLAYLEHGPRTGRPVFFMHAWGGARSQSLPDPGILFELGIRLITPERPGMGLSDAHPEHDLPGWASDVQHLADHLEIQRFCVLGFSLGGMYALACARALPGRVSQVILVAPLAPLRDLTDLDGMPPIGKLLLGLALRLPRLAGAVFRLWVASMRSDPDLYIDSLLPHLSAKDAAVLNAPALRARHAVAFHGRQAQGANALLRELMTGVSNWADLLPIQQPCTLWHGADDAHTPIGHSERLLALMPGARLERMLDSGHYLLHQHWKTILDSIA